ncbi:MAG: ABC transporter permease [Vicinamibacterales bacterium]|nr:ABC transporter permease [Vicinamibacterales bacterium]
MRLYLEVVTQALGSLVAHRFRAALTMMGIAGGIVTVVLLMAYGSGFQRALMYGFRNAFSEGTVVASGGQTSMQAGGERSGRRIVLKQADVDAIRELGWVKFVSPENMASLPVGYGLRQTTAGVRGVAPEYAIMRTENAEHGRFISHEDVEGHRRVAFLGYEVARRLFSGIPPVGETVRINGLPFEVIGVMPNKAQISNYFYPDKLSVFVPWTVSGRGENVDNIVFQTVNPLMHDRSLKQVRELLATRHRFNPTDARAVNLRDSGDTAAMLAGITDGLQFVLYFIGILTLMIGGVGVMNIMLVSVNERTREIGVRKALGARRRHILTQFLLEAMTITFVGGLIGITLSYFLVWAIGTTPFLAELIDDPSRQTDIQLVLSQNILLTSTSILAFAGIVSGFWPAVRASRLDPIEALRYE